MFIVQARGFILLASLSMVDKKLSWPVGHTTERVA